jgi:hypothetical protein
MTAIMMMTILMRNRQVVGLPSSGESKLENVAIYVKELSSSMAIYAYASKQLSRLRKSIMESS